MLIAQMWFRQRSLKRAWMIPELVAHVRDGGFLADPVELQECDDGEIEILDGHHRVVSLWLAGLVEFRPEDFVLYGEVRPAQRFWKVEEFQRFLPDCAYQSLGPEAKTPA